MYHDDESQSLVQKRNQNPQDAPQQAQGQRMSSYSDWSQYDKVVILQSDDGVKQKRIFIALICIILVLICGYSLHRSNQTKLQSSLQGVEESSLMNNNFLNNNLPKTPKSNHTPSSAMQDVFSKLNAGLKQKFKTEDVEDPELTHEERNKKHSDDKQTIDQVLKEYVLKAQQQDQKDLDDNGMNPLKEEVQQKIPQTLDYNQEQIENKLLEQQELDEQSVIDLDEIQINHYDLSDLLDETDETDEIEDEVDQQIEVQQKELQNQIEDGITIKDETIDLKVEETKKEELENNQEVVEKTEEQQNYQIQQEEPQNQQIDQPTDSLKPQYFESKEIFMREDYDVSDDYESQLFDDIIVPQSSNQVVRLMILKNKVKVLMIQDSSDSNMFEMGLSIKSGAWNDPVDQPGLSSLMQHMILEAIPVQNYSSLFQSTQSRGGLSEAFTEDIFTNFQIDMIDLDGFQETLQQFMSILGRPQLSMDRVLEQSKEIEGEDTITLVGDNQKLIDIIKLLAGSNHPIVRHQSQWMTESQDTLPNTLLEHYSNQFSSNLISVVIKSDQSITQIQDLIMNTDLKKLINKDIQPTIYNADNLPLSAQNTIFKFRVTRDFGFKLLIQLHKYPLYNQFLQFIMMQTGKGSLGETLNKLQLGENKIILNNLEFAETYHFTTIQFMMGQQIEDLKKVFTILKVYHNYLTYLSIQDLSSYYQEFLSFKNMKFNFMAQDDENILLLAQKLHKYETEGYQSILEGQIYPFVHDEFLEFLAQFTQNFIILIGRKDYKFQKESQPKKENLEFILQSSLQQHNEEYRLDYSTQEIQQDQIDYIRALDMTFDFSLPSMQEFLPQNFQLKSTCQNIQQSSDVSEEEIPVKQLNLKQIDLNRQFDDVLPPLSTLKDVQFDYNFKIPQIFEKGSLEQCALRERQALDQHYPFQLDNRVWWKPSQILKSPQIFFSLFIQSNQSPSIQRSTALAKIHQKYLQELINQHFQNEILHLNYQIKIECNYNGLNLQALSWSDTSKKFLELIANFLKGGLKTENDLQLFTNVKTIVESETEDFQKQQLQTLTIQYYFPQIMLRPIHTPEQIRQSLQDITFQDFNDYQNELFTNPQNIQVAFVGNLLANEAVEYGQQLFKDLGVSPVQGGKVYWTNTLNLQGKSLIYPVKGNIAESSIYNFYQIGLRDTKSVAILHFIASFLQQSSPSLQIRLKSIGCTDGLAIYQQGNYSPQEMNKQIEELFAHQQYQVGDLSDSNFNQLRQNIINKFQHEKIFSNIFEEGQFIWERIFNNNYGFNVTVIIQFKDIQDMVRGLESMQRSEVIQFYNELFGGQLYGKMSVQVYGTTTQQTLNINDEEEFKQIVYPTLKENESLVFGTDDIIKVDRNYFESFYALN